MKLRPLSTSLVLTLGALLVAAAGPRMLGTSHAQSVKAPTEIKVGITEYQDVEASYERYEKRSRKLTAAANADEPVSFKFAIGLQCQFMINLAPSYARQNSLYDRTHTSFGCEMCPVAAC